MLSGQQHFLAVPSRREARYWQTDSHLLLLAQLVIPNKQMVSSGLDPLRFMPSKPTGAWAAGCRLKARSALSGAAPTTRSRTTARRRLRVFPTSRSSWCRNVRSCWHRAPWAPIWWVSSEHGVVSRFIWRLRPSLLSWAQEDEGGRTRSRSNRCS